MNKIQFWYPTVKDEMPFEDQSNIQHKHGSIRVINLDHEPYEAIINTEGSGFHAIFGSQINGHFLCIPDWGMGCELGPYNDQFWNTNSIYSSGRVSYEDACGLSNALELLEFFLGKKVMSGE